MKKFVLKSRRKISRKVNSINSSFSNTSVHINNKFNNKSFYSTPLPSNSVSTFSNLTNLTSTISTIDFRKVLVLVITITTSILTLIYATSFFLSLTQADTPTYPHGPVEPSNVSITSQGDIDMSLTPTPNGNNITVQDNTTTVSTNNVAGYNLTINTNSPTDNKLTHLSQGFDTYSINPIDSNPNPTPLIASSWGYTTTNPANPNTATFSTVPTSSSPTTIKTTTEANDIDTGSGTGTDLLPDEVTTYYGAKVDYNSIPAGQYGNTIVYSALSNLVEPPTITSITPNTGEPSGGETITITGTNYDSIISITIGNELTGYNDCTNIQITSATTVTCTTPAGTGGQKDLVITNQGGTVTQANGFTYVNSNPPNITSITPNEGTIFGNTEVTIVGSDFGEYNVKNMEYSTCGHSKTFTATMSGTYLLEAWGAAGVGRSTKQHRGSGGYTAGEVTLNAGDSLYVYVGCQGQAPAANVSNITYAFNGGAYIHGDTGGDSGGGGGATDFRLTNGSWDDLTSLQSRILVAGGGGGGYSVNATQHGNQNGTMNGGQNGTWNATNCAVDNGRADFGKGGARNTSDDAGGGGGGWYGGCSWGDSNSGGGSPYVFTSSSDKTGYGSNIPDSKYYISNSTIAVGNTSMPDPTDPINSTNMTTGKQGDGYARISLIGESISEVSSVYLGDAECIVSSWTDTSITCTTSTSEAGIVDVVVSSSNGKNGTLNSGYTYIDPRPIVTSISPNSGHFRGGETFTITGKNFTGATMVTLVGSACRAFTIISDTEIKCVSSGVPVSLQTNTGDGSGYFMTNPIENGSVNVSNLTGTNLVNTLFTYRYPNSSFTTGGSYIDIKGEDFVLGSRFQVGGTNCKDQKIISNNRGSCITPSLTAGSNKALTITQPPTFIRDIQNFNETCSAPYGTIRVLRDNRDNQNYRVRCMEDGHWWMIDNLKLAGGTTLTTANTNLNGTQGSDFAAKWATLSAPVQDTATHNNGVCTNDSSVTITNGSGFLTCDGEGYTDASDGFVAYSDPAKGTKLLTWMCNSQVMVNRDSLTNCGYLYNWYTATAGSGKYTTAPHTSVTASICPAGWHLPYNTSTDSFAVLNNSMLNGYPSSATYTNTTATRSNWRYNGKFQGTSSGNYYSSFSSQYNGYYWTARSYSDVYAYSLSFDSESVRPNMIPNKFYGQGIRCTI
ncbi:IPT/TIG domain-containing protein [Ruminococcaceae bacterium OttesenSCG-928-A11]|nr:IPT/TIG domain-containing protein [Ruminococcaceae bacterium OttesenSCG-928-A11]